MSKTLVCINNYLHIFGLTLDNITYISALPPSKRGRTVLWSNEIRINLLGLLVLGNKL